MDKKAKIALVSFDSLGDGLIYLMMAENLHRNHFDVTCYGNIACQLKNWMPQLALKAYPSPENLNAELEVYDLVIMSPPQWLRNQMTNELTQEMRQKWLLICQKAPSSWYFDHKQRLKNSLPAALFQQLADLVDCSGSIRFKAFTNESVVQMTLTFMQEKMHLNQVDKWVSLTPPLGLQYRRFKNRIIISPDSAGPEKKNWTPIRFLELCRQLRQLGHSPVIVVAPSNHDQWLNLAKGAFEVPLFNDIADLAAYIYESGAVIANDSGNGHLASFLNVPVLTVYRKRNQYFHWRPDWANANVVCPTITIPWFGEIIWKPFVRSKNIIRQLNKINH